jgi:N-acetylglutamate synthase-like GNAT family acetyltransferase
MIIRNIRNADVPQVRKLCEEYRKTGFSMPEPGSIFADALIEHDGKVLGYGVLKHLAEAIMVLDHSVGVKERGEALTLLIQEAVKEASKKGLLEVQAVCEPKFAGVMKRHYGFQKLQGEVLILDI